VKSIQWNNLTATVSFFFILNIDGWQSIAEEFFIFLILPCEIKGGFLWYLRLPLKQETTGPALTTIAFLSQIFFFSKFFFLRDHGFSFSIVRRHPTISIWHHVLSFERRVLSPDRLVRGVCCSMSSLSHTARSFDFSVCLVCFSLLLSPHRPDIPRTHTATTDRHHK
jgi:hypothetical protein